MITEPNEFMQKLQELQDSSSVTYSTLPSNEPRFIIDANSRTIKIPPEFQFLGVKNDHKAETVYFEIDRYFDNEDLSTHTCVVQFENKSGEGGIYPVTIMDTESIDGKIIFGWEILSDATTIVGDIIFSVRFYSLDNYVFTYNFNTLPAKSVILDTLNVDDPTVVENYPSELEAWLDRMNNLSQNVVKPEDVELLDTKMNTLETSFGELETNVNSSVAELKSDLVNYLDVETKTLSYTKGKYINGYGTISDGSNYEYSEPFAMIKGEVLKVFMRSANGIIPLSKVKNVDSSYTPIVKTHTTDKSSWLTYTVETSGNYAICLDIANMEENGESPIVVIEHLTGRIKANEDDIQDLTETKISYFENVELVSGKYISYSNGAEQTLSYLKYGVFKVAPNTKIIYKETNSSLDLRGLAFFKEDGTFVKGYQMIATEQEIIVPSNATILKATVSTYKGVVILNENTIIDVATRLSQAEDKIDSIVGSNPLDIISSDANFVSSFGKIACIGDSLTAGNLNYNGSSTGEYEGISTSYPSILAKFTGNTVLNFGRGGITAKDYITIAESKGVFETSNKCNAYIISLGTNDIGYNGSFSGDTTTDIDLANCENNANTSVGRYSKLIQKILEFQPKAKIFCSCIPNTRNSLATRTEANTKIKSIVELFPNNCYVMDFQTYGVKVEDVDDWKSKYYNGGHLNALGYNLFAKMVLSYMNWIIENNPNHFRNIGFIGTDYDWN